MDTSSYSIQSGDGNRNIIGYSPQMRSFFTSLNTLVHHPDSSSPVLITGETGTGKDLVARALHYNGARASSPFLPVNINTLTTELVESLLFGHKRGAFTGAYQYQEGFFSATKRGTLFLDEIGDLPSSTQVKLLRVLEGTHGYYPLGSTSQEFFEGRVIAATRFDLEELVRNGRFREDLFYRLNVFRLHLPPLRERREDILPLFMHFVNVYNTKHKSSYNPNPSREGSSALLAHSFPGNVRELQNLIPRATLSSLNGSKYLPVESILSRLVQRKVSSDLNSLNFAAYVLKSHSFPHTPVLTTFLSILSAFFSSTDRVNLYHISKLSQLDRSHVRRFLDSVSLDLDLLQKYKDDFLKERNN